MSEPETTPRFAIHAIPDAEREEVAEVDHEMQLRGYVIHALTGYEDHGWRAEWGHVSETGGSLTEYFPSATEAALEAERQSLADRYKPAT